MLRHASNRGLQKMDFINEESVITLKSPKKKEKIEVTGAGLGISFWLLVLLLIGSFIACIMFCNKKSDLKDKEKNL